MNGFSSKRIALKVGYRTGKYTLCRARPCSFQPGNFTVWGVLEWVKVAGGRVWCGWGSFCAWAVLRTSVGFHTKASPGPDNFGDLAAVE